MFLGVNIDHIATLRNARGGVEPDPIEAALICEANGASSITAHLREDRRHIKDKDVSTLKKVIKTKLNLEMAVSEEIREIALNIHPDYVCLVPEKREEITTEGGLDVAGQVNKITKFISPLIDAGIQVSLFIDPIEEQIRASAKTGAQCVELHTGQYSMAFGTVDEQDEFYKISESSRLVSALGLKVNAGHGLNYQNVYRMKQIPDLCELNIGHSIISRAVFIGLAKAVSEMAGLVG